MPASKVGTDNYLAFVYLWIPSVSVSSSVWKPLGADGFDFFVVSLLSNFIASLKRSHTCELNSLINLSNKMHNILHLFTDFDATEVLRVSGHFFPLKCNLDCKFDVMIM